MNCLSVVLLTLRDGGVDESNQQKLATRIRQKRLGHRLRRVVEEGYVAKLFSFLHQVNIGVIGISHKAREVTLVICDEAYVT